MCNVQPGSIGSPTFLIPRTARGKSGLWMLVGIRALKNPKVLNSSEDAHTSNMSAFETMSIFGVKSVLASVCGSETA
jgi:hypothetical protein